MTQWDTLSKPNGRAVRVSSHIYVQERTVENIFCPPPQPDRLFTHYLTEYLLRRFCLLPTSLITRSLSSSITRLPARPTPPPPQVTIPSWCRIHLDAQKTYQRRCLLPVRRVNVSVRRNVPTIHPPCSTIDVIPKSPSFFAYIKLPLPSIVCMFDWFVDLLQSFKASESKMSSSQYSYIFKYIIVGDMGVGKSCLLHQFTEQKCKC